MRKFVLAGVIATLGVAMLAIPASASFDRHFSVIGKQVSGGPVGENAFRFKDKLLQPHNRDNRVGRDKGICREASHARSGATPSSTSMARSVASAISASAAISGGAITGSTSSGEAVISTASAARCCSKREPEGGQAPLRLRALTRTRRERDARAAGVGAAPLGASPQTPGNVADRWQSRHSGIVFCDSVVGRVAVDVMDLQRHVGAAAVDDSDARRPRTPAPAARTLARPRGRQGRCSRQ